MKDINRLIALWMRECWHSFRGPFNHPELYICDNCHKSEAEVGNNPDFSCPDHFARLMKRLFGQDKIYTSFYLWAYVKAPKSCHRCVGDWPYIAWLFQPDDQFRYTRFVTLFAEFLRLPETRREFGLETCPKCNGTTSIGHTQGFDGEAYEIPCDCDSGKVLSAWAREEGK